MFLYVTRSLSTFPFLFPTAKNLQMFWSSMHMEYWLKKLLLLTKRKTLLYCRKIERRDTLNFEEFFRRKIVNNQRSIFFLLFLVKYRKNSCCVFPYILYSFREVGLVYRNFTSRYEKVTTFNILFEIRTL